MTDYPMPKTAREHLHKIEQERNVKIIYAIESGSRAWGFASADSDFDIRFVYVRPKRAYLSLATRRDVIDSHDLRLTDPMIDIGGWDVIKLLEQAANSNAQVLEWLTQSSSAYVQDKQFVSSLSNIMLDFNRRKVMHHYAGHAKQINDERLKQTGEKVRVKSYLYTVRCILMCLYFRQNPVLPSAITISWLLHKLENIVPEKVKNTLYAMMANRALHGEFHEEEPNLVLERFIEDHIGLIKDYANKADNTRAPDMLSLEELSYQTIKRFSE